MCVHEVVKKIGKGGCAGRSLNGRFWEGICLLKEGGVTIRYNVQFESCMPLKPKVRDLNLELTSSAPAQCEGEAPRLVIGKKAAEMVIHLNSASNMELWDCSFFLLLLARVRLIKITNYQRGTQATKRIHADNTSGSLWSHSNADC